MFPDLAKEIQGRWNIYEALIYIGSDSASRYNPRDSAQVGFIDVRKIDALRVQILMTVKKNNGETIFQSDYECELSRDFFNEGIILFMTHPDLGGGYHTKEKYIETNGSMRLDDNSGKLAWFMAKR